MQAIDATRATLKDELFQEVEGFVRVQLNGQDGKMVTDRVTVTVHYESALHAQRHALSAREGAMTNGLLWMRVLSYYVI